MKAPKKLIEVALPLDDINAAAAREKPIHHGHPSTLHRWWARRPLAAARVVIFAQMVNDPGGERGYYSGKTKAQADAEREELFDIIRDLVKWENTNNEKVLNRAREAIKKSWCETCELNKGKPGFDPDKLPAFHDPFAGGGAIPLEAQRLGLEAYASDLNPVAVLINKAMIEIPPKFAGRAPVGPIPENDKQTDHAQDWSGAKGLAEDVRRYGHWMREEAFKRIGHLYPQVDLPKEYGGGKATVIAWLWARTVKSPNPAFSHVDVPLISSFFLSTKKGKEAWVKPVVEGDSYRFTIAHGEPDDPEAVKMGTTAGKRSAFICLMSGTPIDYKHIRAEGKAGRMGQKLMAIVAENPGGKGRIYLEPTAEMEEVAALAKPEWRPETALPDNPRDFSTPNYGMNSYGDLFTPRQLVALNTFVDLVQEARERVVKDYLNRRYTQINADKTDEHPRSSAFIGGSDDFDDELGLEAGGSGARAYGEAVGVYLGIVVDKVTDYWSNICSWNSSGEKMRNTFGRQALPMVWDYAEANPFCSSTGNWMAMVDWTWKSLSQFPALNTGGFSQQKDAAQQSISLNKVVSTDPPYYDNIGYADLSDFFYVWLRRTLKNILPDLFTTIAVPKAEELVATPYRHGNKEKAKKFFLNGMTQAMHNMAENSHPAFPVTIYYAFKQSETKAKGTTSTGWETFLDAVIKAGFAITGTWPMRTELSSRMIGSGTNALASSIVLVCRKRDPKATSISRRQFQRELKDTLPEALQTMIGGSTGRSPIAPVDLAQAAIGPGMGVYSQYSAVLEADGSPMPVHDALIMINRAIDEYFNEAEGELDADSRFCVDWFQQYGFSTGAFGEADVLARAKGTSVDGVNEAGVIESGSGKVRLLRFKEYATDWAPETDKRTPVWEVLHHLIRVQQNHSESDSGALLARIPERGESVRQLAYRLYTLCERKGWAKEARAYNELIAAWHSIVAASQERGPAGTQTTKDF